MEDYSPGNESIEESAETRDTPDTKAGLEIAEQAIAAQDNDGVVDDVLDDDALLDWLDILPLLGGLQEVLAAHAQGRGRVTQVLHIAFIITKMCHTIARASHDRLAR